MNFEEFENLTIKQLKIITEQWLAHCPEFKTAQQLLNEMEKNKNDRN